tara:strand:- start:154 stop:426 length:273 start_codon:yes stop_codon:yes gene_type:complete
MKITILEETKERLKLEVDGEDHTLCNALRDELWNVKGVVVAGYTMDHPLVTKPVFVVETDGKEDPRKALLKAVENIKENNKSLKAEVAKL